MKYWYISYTYVDGFGNRQYKCGTLVYHPVIWLKSVSPLNSVLTFYSEITEEEYNIYNDIK